MFDVMPSSIEYIRAGKLRAPTVITNTRSQALSNLHERFHAGLRGKLPYGMVAPKNTAAEILHKLNNEINAAMADPKMMARLAEMGRLCSSARLPAWTSSLRQKPRSGPPKLWVSSRSDSGHVGRMACCSAKLR